MLLGNAAQSESKSAHQRHRQRCITLTQEEVCFGCKGKISLFSFPKNPALCEQWMQFVFPGQQKKKKSFACVYLFLQGSEPVQGTKTKTNEILTGTEPERNQIL